MSISQGVSGFKIMNANADTSPQSSVQKFAIDTAYRLSSLRHFLEASEDLCRFSDMLTSADIQRHGRKLLAMLEVARTTLNRADLKLHLFTSCPEKYQPYKSAYFKMLVLVIRQRQNLFHSELQGRVARLLLPLTTQLVIGRNHDPYAQLGIADLMKNIDSRSQPQEKPQVVEQPTSTACSWRAPQGPSNNIAASMPPPDAFPPKKSEDQRKKRGLLDQAIRRSRPVHRQHPPRPEKAVQPTRDDEDNCEPSGPRVFARTQARRHFGIFCTGNKRSTQLSRR